VEAYRRSSCKRDKNEGGGKRGGGEGGRGRRKEDISGETSG